MAHRTGRFVRWSVGLIVLLVSVGWSGSPLGTGRAFAAGFIDFENGTDGAPIKSTIPGLQFTTTDGQDWIYGDWRTRSYNGPYPNGSYYSNGNFFAWLGANQGDGRIDFTEGNATFLTVKVSTLNNVRLRGYDDANNVIAEAEFSGGNLNTGRLDDLGITAPAGQSFKYVIVSGAANYWLIDDLSTDAAGVPGTPPPGEKPRHEPDPALITVTARPNPNSVASRSGVDFGLFATPPASVANDGIIDYTVTVTNRGAGHAKDTVVMMPFDGAALRLLDATFSTESAYVSRLITDPAAPALEFHSGPIAPSATITATVRLLVRPGVADGTSLGQRLTYTWSDGRSGGSGTSNLPIVVAGAGDSDQPYYPITVTPASAPVATARTLASTVFVPNEPISLWYNTPDGRAVGLGSLVADSTGMLAATFDTAALAAGNYTLVAQGAWSQFTAVSAFTVQP